MPTKNKDKQAGYQRKFYQQNKDYYREKATAKKQSIREFIQSLKCGRHCKYCGEDDPLCLDFHHIDPTTKSIDVANISKYGWGEKRILSEIDKCQLVCSNCHRKLHGGRSLLYPG